MLKVICIEDETEIRMMLAEELEDEGYEVFQASNGEEGLAGILAHHPDLILCDINMPVMNGHELLKIINTQHPHFSKTPFIYLSAFTDQKDIDKGLDLGADYYLTKPIDMDDLLEYVEKCIGRTQNPINTVLEQNKICIR